LVESVGGDLEATNEPIWVAGEGEKRVSRVPELIPQARRSGDQARS
jgi:hypothetical protein